jgi:hypothetical protein
VSAWIDGREIVVINTNLMSDFGRREVENKFKEVYETMEMIFILSVPFVIN